MPWWRPATEIVLCEDARCWGRSAFGLVDMFLPAFHRSWTAGLSANFSWTLAFGAGSGRRPGGSDEYATTDPRPRCCLPCNSARSAFSISAAGV